MLGCIVLVIKPNFSTPLQPIRWQQTCSQWFDVKLLIVEKSADSDVFSVKVIGTKDCSVYMVNMAILFTIQSTSKLTSELVYVMLIMVKIYSIWKFPL